jgi:hypothetical protein
VSGQAFSSDAQPSRGPGRKDLFGDKQVTIRVEPMDQTNPDGSKSSSMGFPVLYVAGWVAEPEAFAAKVAKLLTEHRV